jgi:hypothetical protein
MTNESIEGYIDALNRNEFSEHIFRSILSDTVDYAKVWTDEPRGNVVNEGSYNFYFIKNNVGVYVAAVLDMYSDLHVFVKKEYRKKGILSAAMNNVILPHLSNTGRDKQVVTFEDPNVGNYCVRNWGFALLDDLSAEKNLSGCSSGEQKSLKGYKLHYSDFEKIRAKIGKARLYITMVKEQLEASLGDIPDNDVEYLEQELFNLDDRVLTLIEELQGELA